MFTSHPVTGEPETIVEGSWGLGEAIVSGSVSPDKYVFDRHMGRVVDKIIATKKIAIIPNGKKGTKTIDLPREKQESSVLTEEEVQRLTDYGKIAEDHYGQPQDIEWASYCGQPARRAQLASERSSEMSARVRKVAIVGAVVVATLIANSAMVFLKSKNVPILNDEAYPVNTLDFKPLMTKVKAQNPDFLLLVAVSTTDAILLTRHAKEIGVAPRAFCWIWRRVWGGRYSHRAAAAQ
jgi:pyruvate,water dikinase